MVRHDGTMRWIADRGRAWYDDSGKPVGMAGVNIDITERKELESEIQQSRDALELRVQERTAELAEANQVLKDQAALLDLAHDAIIVRDLDDKVTFWNNGAIETYGYTKEEALGKVGQELLQTVCPEPLDKIRESVLREGRWEGELKNTTSAGQEIIVESRWALKVDGMPLGFLEINREITARKRAEDALKLNMARLEVINEELQEFAFVASHDLQEPLRKIQNFGSLLGSVDLDDEAREYLDRMLKSASRMRQLLDDLLQYARVASRLEPFKEMDLGRIVREAADVFEREMKDMGAEIEIDDLPRLEVDESQMLRLFQNLISNALRFRSDAIPLIRVYAKCYGPSSCDIYVKDNGIGFQQQYAELIFKPFQSLHRRSRYEGTGMGLAICRKIVERHGGFIRARVSRRKARLSSLPCLCIKPGRRTFNGSTATHGPYG